MYTACVLPSDHTFRNAHDINVYSALVTLELFLPSKILTNINAGVILTKPADRIQLFLDNLCYRLKMLIFSL